MTTDFHGRPVIPKGTTVRVRTTNGGDTIRVLAHDYRETYDVILDWYGTVVVIPSFRITSVKPVSA
jgi:hypothetical protein